MFDSILEILKLSNAFSAVTRDQKAFTLDRRENDSEHSYQLALVVWYLADHFNLPFDRNKLLRYSLVHDLVEVYAGDTAPFTGDVEKNESLHESKAARELAALEQLKKEFPTFDEMLEAIEHYDQKGDPESRFIYIVDKIIADLNCYINGEQYYKDRKSPYSHWIHWFETKMKKLENPSELEKTLMDEYFNFMKKNKSHYFPDQTAS